MNALYHTPTVSAFDPPVWGNVTEARLAIAAHRGTWSCEVCYRAGSRRTTQAHHIIPKCERMIHSWGNLVMLCPDCHYDLAHQMPRAITHRSAFIEGMRIARARDLAAVNEWVAQCGL